MGDSPQRIWIEQDECPYFYEESELADVGSPVTEYIRADLCHRPAPAATDTGLVTVATVWPEGELVTRSQAEAIIRDLETKILEAAISDRLDDAGSPLTWQERAEKAEADNAAKDAEIAKLIHDLNRIKDHETELVNDNAAKDARIKELDRCHEGTIDLCNQKTAQIEALEAKLAAAHKALEPFANAADGRKSKSVTGAACFSQHYLLAARAVLGGKP